MNKITFPFACSPQQYPKYIASLVWFLFWLLLFSACTPQSEASPTATPRTSIQETEMAQATIATTPGSTMATGEVTAIPTASPTASRTATTTATPTAAQPTTTPTETITPMPTSTLTAEEMRQRWQTIDAQVEALMATNNGCLLPCWWGIEPGDTVTHAWEIFDTVNENGWVDSPARRGELEEIGFIKHIYRNELAEDIYAGFSITLLVEEDLIEVIDIYVARNVTFDIDTPEYNQIGERLTRDWQQFSIQSMFERFGEPDLISIMPRTPGYTVNIFYLDLGIAASYRPNVGSNELSERTICLDMLDMFNIMSMNLFLYAPKTGLPPGYVQATYPLWPLGPELLIPEDTRMVELSDLESRTGISIDEFVGMVLDDESTANCLIWR